MTLRIDTHAEPLPGYRLIERLGRGGFGEVWKAEAPGGLHKAIKFVYGDLRNAHEGAGLAEQELKALSRVKSVRHPYILSLERFDVIEGQLIIVMELADRNLADRFRECAAEGLPGIPRVELLRYLEEAAEALDLMNIECQLQHLDIKPQNLFLVHNHVKVADFGLVKGLQGTLATMTGGVTPLYAAPETFDSTVSRFCDQYSLAIVYQELLTGRRPFSGTTARQLLMQHVQGVPDLSALPPSDREPIARALAKKPAERHPSCLDLVKALRAGEGSKVIVPFRPFEAIPESLRTDTHVSPAMALSTPSTPRIEIRPGVEPDSGFVPLPPGVNEASPPPLPMTMRTTVLPAATAEVHGDGVLYPALVIAVGQVGLSVVKRMRDGLCARFGSLKKLPNLRVLYIDTDQEAVRAATESTPGLALSSKEVLFTRLNRASHFLKPRERHVPLDSWFDARLLYRMPRNQSTAGVRALGRLALMDNYQEITGRLRSDLKAIADPEALGVAVEQTGLGMRTNQPRVYIVAGLSGGTGSGMFLDLAYVARAMLRHIGFVGPDVCGLLLLPGADAEPSRALAVANTMAALLELGHFSSQRVTFQAHYDVREEPLCDSEPPFNRCMLVPLPRTPDETGPRVWPGLAAGYLVRELTSSVGRKLDESRSRAAAPGKTGGPLCQTFNAFRFACPRRVILRRGARRLCRRLVKAWMASDEQLVEERVQSWFAEQWQQQRLTPDRLLSRLQERCQRALGQEPETLFTAITERFLEHANSSPNLDPQEAARALRHLEQLLGRPEEEGTSIRTTITEALDTATRRTAARWGDKLTAVALGGIEQPGIRLAGAEVVLRHIQAALEQVVSGQEALAHDYAKLAGGAYVQLHSQLDHLQVNVPGGRLRPPTAAEFVDLLHQYAKNRYHSLVLRRAVQVCQGLLARVPDFAREITTTRSRLGELLESLRTPSTTRVPEVDLGPGRTLLPGGQQDADQLVNQSLDSLTAKDLQEVEQRLQEAVQPQFKSLAQACLSSGSVFKEFEALLRQQAEKFVETRLRLNDAAAMYLDQPLSSQEMKADLADAFHLAAPALAAARTATSAEICLVSLPTGEAGERLARLVSEALPDVNVTPVASADDLVIYREQPQLPLSSLPQLGLVAHDAYRRLLQAHGSPHNRIDVLNWLPVG